MSHKRLLVQSAARERILHGALALADAVRETLGPKSTCVLIEKKWGRPIVCNDGVTIAKECELQDHEENLGAQVIRQAAERAGDERTDALILKRALEVLTRQIGEPSAVDGGVVVDRMRSGSGAYGFDAGRGTYVDLVDAGIIDPTKVVRIALENAVSVAGGLLLTEATLTEVPEPKRETPPPDEMD